MRPSTIFLPFQKLRFGGRQSNVSMTIVVFISCQFHGHVRSSLDQRQQAVPAAMFVVCVRMCWPRVVLRTTILVRAVLRLLQFTSLWRSRLLNTGAGIIAQLL